MMLSRWQRIFENLDFVVYSEKYKFVSNRRSHSLNIAKAETSVLRTIRLATPTNELGDVKRKVLRTDGGR